MKKFVSFSIALNILFFNFISFSSNATFKLTKSNANFRLSPVHDLLTPCDSPLLFEYYFHPSIESIENEDAFIIFSENVNSGNDYKDKMVILENDLDLEDFDWNSIGNESSPFKGIFEGNNHNINIGDTDKALFYFADNAQISNIKLLGKCTPLLIANANNVKTCNCYCS